MLLDNNKFTPNEFMKNLNDNDIWLESNEIEEIIGLEPGKLKCKEEEGKIIKINFKK